MRDVEDKKRPAVEPSAVAQTSSQEGNTRFMHLTTTCRREKQVLHRIVLGIASIIFVAIAVSSPRAQSYPSKPVRIILPQPAGGAVDIIARTLGSRLEQLLNGTIVVESMPGANGAIAASRVARSAPDGHTLFLVGDNTFTVNPHLYNNLNYDSFKDFAPISILTRLDMVLVANPKLPFHDVPELIATPRNARPN
jgi:tripartite-type tricarboxylate transporter receptor subunit TctC